MIDVHVHVVAAAIRIFGLHTPNALTPSPSPAKPGEGRRKARPMK
jgi:hypothetical protein